MTSDERERLKALFAEAIDLPTYREILEARNRDR